MDIFFAGISVVVALAGQWFFAAWGPGLWAYLPLAGLTAVWWLERMTYLRRMVFALLAGLVCDAARAHPWGTYIIVFVLLAVAFDFLQTAFSAQESLVARGTGAGIVLLFFFLLVPSVSNIMITIL